MYSLNCEVHSENVSSAEKMYKTYTSRPVKDQGAFLWCVLVGMSAVSQCLVQCVILRYKQKSLVMPFALLLPYTVHNFSSTRFALDQLFVTV